MKHSVAYLGDPVRHFWMTRSVARMMGLSLSDAIAEGRLRLETYEAMVTSCRRCPQVGTCEGWLARQTGDAAEAPAGCANGVVLNVLKQGAPAPRQPWKG